MMPKGPKGEKRPADVIGNAVHVMRILGEIEDTVHDDGKDPAAVALGRKGGKARADGMSAKRRAEIAKKAAAKGGGNDARLLTTIIFSVTSEEEKIIGDSGCFVPAFIPRNGKLFPAC